MPQFYTPTEEALLEILADGMCHPRSELHQCLPDKLSAEASVKMHISRLRKKITPLGRDIVCERRDSEPHYRHVRLVGSGHE